MRFTQTFLLLIIVFVQGSLANNLEWAGDLSVENRFFFSEGLYENKDQSHLGFALNPQLSYSWDEDRKVITINPFYRLSDPDEDRSHFDLRELSFVGAWDSWEFRVGVSRVFWGVTESVHLVDVINQIDFVENVDGEDRLGQTMVATSYLNDNFGVFSLFILPQFRERTFPGPNGRFRGGAPVDVGQARYESEAKDSHVDWASRWSHYIGAFEFGLSYFQGTDREPQFFENSNGQLTPFYAQAKQVSLDGQYIFEDWILKLESLFKNTHFRDEFISSVYGFEYTFSNKWGGKDIGILLEHIYDDRLTKSTVGFYNHLFFGTRLAFNDVLGTEILVGGFHNNDNGKIGGMRLEATRRITNNFKWELEANWTFHPPASSVLYQVREDDYLQATLAYYF